MNKPKVTIKDISEAPNLQELKEHFVVDENYLIVAYGDAIYTPKGQALSKDLIIHELVHCMRQGYSVDSAKLWWEKYMRDKQFRIDEEALAYNKQYAYCCVVYKDREVRSKILLAMANQLASEQYGKVITSSEAANLIKQNVN